MKQTLAIIDGDSLCYLSSKGTIQESISNIDSRISDILTKTKCTHYYLFLSEGRYFRYDVNADYKASRSGSASPLLYLKTLKQYLKEQYYGESWKNVEADDAVAYTQNKFLNGDFKLITDSVICSPDKDVIKQVPGNNFNYQTSDFNTTTQLQADLFLHIQSIMGDSTDNIKGIPGIGEVKAGKLLADVHPENQAIAAYKAYLEYYKVPGQALYEYQKNFRQVYLLRTDADFQNEVGYIPELQPPIAIIN